MFNKEDEYLNATKEAQLYTSVQTKSSNKKLIIINIFLLALLGFATFIYLQNSTNIFSNLSLSSLPISKQAVLGVSEIVDDADISIAILEENSMKVLINEPSIQSKSSYTEAISRELDDKNGFRGRIAVVNYDDSLSKN